MKNILMSWGMNLTLAVSAYFAIIYNHNGSFNVVTFLTWCYAVMSFIVLIASSSSMNDSDFKSEVLKTRSAKGYKFMSASGWMLDVVLILSFAYIGEFMLSSLTAATLLFNGAAKVSVKDPEKE